MHNNNKWIDNNEWLPFIVTSTSVLKIEIEMEKRSISILKQIKANSKYDACMLYVNKKLTTCSLPDIE